MPLLNGNHKHANRRASYMLNVLELRYNPSFYESIAAVMALRKAYLQNRYIFVPGADMIPILKVSAQEKTILHLLRKSANSQGQTQRSIFVQ